MPTKRPTLTLKGRTRSRKTVEPSESVGTRSVEQFGRATSYIAPDLGDIYAGSNDEPDLTRVRMSSTIEEDEEFESSVYGVGSVDEAYMGGTQADLQLSRIQHLDPAIQRGIQVLAQGGSISGIDPLDAAAALEEFGSQIQGDPALWANQLNVDESVNLPRLTQDKKTILSVLQNTSGEYFDKGPGSQLAGHTLIGDRQAKMDEDFQMAMQYVGDLAGLYIDPRSQGTSAFEVKKRLLTQSLTNRFLEGTFSDEANSILPLPNETGITGIRPTASFRGFTGTKFDRVGFDIYAEERGLTSEDDAFWEHKPNIKGSLFPIKRKKGNTVEDAAKGKRDQDHAFDQALFKARFARKILREQMPTNRDESAGQMRMSGFDTPYGEQADRMNLLNEAAIQDLDFQQVADEAVDRTFDVEAAGGKGSDRGGAYGLNPVSEVDVFVEREGMTLEEYEAKQTGNVEIEGIEQRTPAWYAARKGMITASKLTNASGRMLSKEELAKELAMERLGLSKEFVGNAHTEEGIRGEEIALQSFLFSQKKLGNPLTHTEVGLLQNAKYPGFGASPDGRLSDSEGTSRGLLELKYLTSGAMDKALKKYTPQMQLQMAITGEEQTHFFALDKYTGESIHEIVKADPNMQKKIFETGIQAKALEAGLDARGVQQMIRQTKEQRSAGSVTPTDTSGQTESFKVSNDITAPMTGFRINNGQVGDSMVQMYEQERAREQAAIAQAWAESDPAAEFIAAAGAGGNGGKNTEADKEEARASKEAAASIRELGNQARTAANVMSELGGIVMAGNKSGMDEVRFAAETGLDVNRVRGMREALERGGLSTGGINRVVGQAGSLAKTFNDEATGAREFTRIMGARGKSNIEAVRNLDLPSLQSFQDMNPQQMLGMVAGLMEGQSAQAKAQIGQMFGMAELATSDISPETITGAVDTSLDEAGQRSTLQGITTVEQLKREALEETGELGSTAGSIASGSVIAGAVVGSATAGFVGNRAAQMLATKALPSAKVASMAKSLSTAAKVTPIALAASVAPMAIRHVADIKDDGSVGDSAMDILEFAAYGAAAGSIVPGVGTLVGAGVGTGIGIVNEAIEYFGDDPVPSQNIGPMKGVHPDLEQGKPVVNNIEVNTTVTKDGITTEVMENGDQIYLEEDNSTGFAQ